jgi:hypothetical protein
MCGSGFLNPTEIDNVIGVVVLVYVGGLHGDVVVVGLGGGEVLGGWCGHGRKK